MDLIPQKRPPPKSKRKNYLLFSLFLSHWLLGGCILVRVKKPPVNEDLTDSGVELEQIILCMMSYGFQTPPFSHPSEERLDKSSKVHCNLF